MSIATKMRASRTVVLARPWSRHPRRQASGRRVARSRMVAVSDLFAWAAAVSQTRPRAQSARRQAPLGAGESFNERRQQVWKT